MTDVRFCGTAFCIVDFMGDIEAPDRETERRTHQKQKEITFQNRVDGNICSYFFQHARDRNMTYIYKRSVSTRTVVNASAATTAGSRQKSSRRNRTLERRFRKKQSRGSISRFNTLFWMIFARTARPNMPMKPEHLLRNGKR